MGVTKLYFSRVGFYAGRVSSRSRLADAVRAAVQRETVGKVAAFPTRPRVTGPTMNARDSSPGEGHDSDGEEEESIARTIVEDEIAEIDKHTDRAGTAAVRCGRDDLLEELTEHLRGLADWLEEDVDVDGVDDELQDDDVDT